MDKDTFTSDDLIGKVVFFLLNLLQFDFLSIFFNLFVG